MSSNKLNLFFLNLSVDQYKENPRKRRGTTLRKPVRQCGPAIGLRRKMLRIAVGGIFEHKPLFSSSAKRNPQKKTGEKNSENNSAGELKVLENSLDFLSLGPQGPLRQPAKPQSSFRKLRLSPLLGSFTSSMRLRRHQGRQC